jgi:hypothetical protein
MTAWEEIHGFASPAEYERFTKYIERSLAVGAAKEVPADPRYQRGMIFGGRWFQELETGSIWRLVAPDHHDYGSRSYQKCRTRDRRRIVIGLL